MANDNAKTSKTSGLKAWLDTNVPAFIKQDHEFGKVRDEVFQKATAHALFHGDAMYLIMLDAKLTAATRVTLGTFLRNVNKNGLKILFEGHDEERNMVLSAIEGENQKRDMIVTVFGRSSKQEGQVIKVSTGNASKLFRKGLADIYKTDEALAKALSGISDVAQEEDNQRANAAFDYEDYLSKVIQTVIRKLAPVNPAEAKRVANGINNLIADTDERFSKKEIELMVAKNAPANKNDGGSDEKENKATDEVGKNQDMAA